jgi:hypothetical protein
MLLLRQFFYVNQWIPAINFSSNKDFKLIKEVLNVMILLERVMAYFSKVPSKFRHNLQTTISILVFNKLD